MRTEEIYISAEHLKAGMHAALPSLMGEDGPQELYEPVRALVDSQGKQALYLPTVKFIVDATVAIVSIPSIERQLSNEVLDRASTASSVASTVAKVGTETGLFLASFSGRPELEDVAVNENEINSFLNHRYVASIGAAPFGDVARVGGGALRFLRMHGYDTKTARDAIVQSKGLLGISGVHKGWLPDLFDVLGRGYVSPVNFALQPGPEPRVGFDPATKDLVKTMQLKNGGCPAGRIKAESPFGKTVLEEYWQRIVEFVIADDATTNSR